MRFHPLKQKLFNPSLFVKTLLFLALAVPAVCHAVSVGEPAPFFKLKGIQNKIYQLKDFKNKVVFINFWASWCSPCRKELPLLDELQARYKDLVVLAINIDEDKEIAEQFIQQYHIQSLVLFDSKIEVVSQYEAVAMPTSFILDGDGIVRFLHYGFNFKTDPAMWDREVLRLLVKE